MTTDLDAGQWLPGTLDLAEGDRVDSAYRTSLPSREYLKRFPSVTLTANC